MIHGCFLQLSKNNNNKGLAAVRDSDHILNSDITSVRSAFFHFKNLTDLNNRPGASFTMM